MFGIIFIVKRVFKLRLNNKGLAVSGIIYSILILFLILIFGILGILGSRKMILDKLKNDVLEQLNQSNEGPSSASFALDSWETIAEMVRTGKALEVYNVGDTKEVTVDGYTNGDETTFTVRIANMSTPEQCNNDVFSQTACGFVIEFEDIITTHNMNSTSTNVGGWPGSKMYSFVNNDIYNALPSDLRNVIIDTYTVSGHGYSESSNFTSIDKLYLLSTKEVWGKEGTSNTIGNDKAEAETRQLDYYKNNGVTTSNYSIAIKTYQGSAYRWWLRSANSGGSNFFYNVNTSGDWEYYGATTTNGVAPAFRIG